jgi:ribosomal protein L11 methyltransferase
LILSGLLNEQADEIIDVYARSGANLVHHEVIGEWSSLTLRKDG